MPKRQAWSSDERVALLEAVFEHPSIFQLSRDLVPSLVPDKIFLASTAALLSNRTPVAVKRYTEKRVKPPAVRTHAAAIRPG